MAKTSTSRKTGAPKKAAPKKTGAPKKAAPKKAAPKKAAPKSKAKLGLKGKAQAAMKSVAKRVSKAASSAMTAVKGAAQSAAKAAKRVVPKRSASYGASIEDFAAKLPEWQKQVVDELVALVKSASPGATGMVKWGQPVFDLKGPFAFIKPAKAHVTMGFWRGAELNDQQGILDGAGKRMKHLKIAKGDAIPVSLLQRLIAEAVRLNETHGDPTKKRKG